MSNSISVLFVCLGNICRSPMAEGVFRQLVEEEGLDGRIRIDSAGTGDWHVGETPDPRASAVARKNGVELESIARTIEVGDLGHFDYVLAMDRENLHDIHALHRAHGGDASIHLFREFDPDAEDDLEVPDPYFGAGDGFDRVYEMIHRTAGSLLDHISAELDSE
ncbi:low molecular weight protein-tyrosine-phosphatase [Gemmatimonadota bacterium]